MLASAVGTLTAGTSEGDDGNIVVLDVLGKYLSRWHPLSCTQWSSDAECRTTLRIVLLVFICNMLLIGLGKAHVGLHACISHSLDHTYNIWPDVCSTKAHGCRHHVVACASIESDIAHATERERFLIVLEQYHTLSTELAHELGMTLEVGLVWIDIAVWGVALEHELESALHAEVDECHVEAAVLGCIEYCLTLPWLTRLKHVVACLDACHCILACVPVAHHQTVPSPLVAEDCFGEIAILTGVFALSSVVCRHDRPRI